MDNGQIPRRFDFVSFALGGAFFLAASYVLHCGMGLGPWKCQRRDFRHLANGEQPALNGWGWR